MIIPHMSEGGKARGNVICNKIPPIVEEVMYECEIGRTALVNEKRFHASIDRNLLPF